MFLLGHLHAAEIHIRQGIAKRCRQIHVRGVERRQAVREIAGWRRSVWRCDGPSQWLLWFRLQLFWRCSRAASTENLFLGGGRSRRCFVVARFARVWRERASEGIATFVCVRVLCSRDRSVLCTSGVDSKVLAMRLKRLKIVFAKTKYFGRCCRGIKQ